MTEYHKCFSKKRINEQLNWHLKVRVPHFLSCIAPSIVLFARERAIQYFNFWKHAVCLIVSSSGPTTFGVHGSNMVGSKLLSIKCAKLQVASLLASC